MQNQLTIENLNIDDDVPAPVDEEEPTKQGFQWTQEKDEILISQYGQFESLGSKGCFELLSALIPGTTAKECYQRGKLLQLKKLNSDQSRAKSLQLLSDASHSLADKKVAIALQKYVLGKLNQAQENDIAKSVIQQDLDFIKNICKEYKEFR